MTTSIWDFWAGCYDYLLVQHVSLGPTRREIIARLPAEREFALLDIGCGTAQLLGDMESRNGFSMASYTGVDRSKRMIDVASRKHPNGNYIVSDIQSFDPGSRTYDVIVCSHALPYFNDRKAALGKAADMLAPGGTLIIANALTNSLYDRLVLAFVKLTTSKAVYPSRNEVIEDMAPIMGSPVEAERICRSFFMPSVYLFRWAKGNRT